MEDFIIFLLEYIFLLLLTKYMKHIGTKIYFLKMSIIGVFFIIPKFCT